MSTDDDKLQIVAFSTNETHQTPIDIINTFLEQQNHVILKKTRSAIAFSTTLRNSTKPTRIMICSIINLGREYTGITDVNCYMIFVDLEQETSKEKFDSIINYAKDYCELSKKVFILGMTNANKTTEKTNIKITKDDITSFLENSDISYEYNEIDLSNIKEICDKIMNILIYSSKNAISGELVQQFEKDQSGSCNIL